MNLTPERRGFSYLQWLKCILELNWRRNDEPHSRGVNSEIRAWHGHLRENRHPWSHRHISSQMELKGREEGSVLSEVTSRNNDGGLDLDTTHLPHG